VLDDYALTTTMMTYLLHYIAKQDIILFTGAPVIDFSQIEIPGTSSTELAGLAAAAAGAPSPEDPKTLRDMILASPHDLAMLKERNPPLADALLSGNLGLCCKNVFFVICVQKLGSIRVYQVG